MAPQPDLRVLFRPLVCFGSVLLLGVLGFAYAKLTNNGIGLIGFLIFYVPFSLLALVLGAVFAVKAYAVLPAKHWGKCFLTAAIALVVVLLLICFAVFAELTSHPPGGF
jgi:uncharacterized membrane protein (UPF0136 family)